MKNFCLILLTYKGKVLLLQKDDILHNFLENDWHFIDRYKDKHKSLETTITDEVERETNIKLDSVNLVLRVPRENRTEHLFHARLTDKQVNNIQRNDGKILQFFTLQELKKLQLHPSIAAIMSDYTSLIENLVLPREIIPTP